METSFDWAFRDSPALVLMVDAELVCRGLSGAWCDRIDLEVNEEASIPLDALLALDKSPALRGQLERLFDQGKQISNLPAELRLSEGIVAVTLSAWRVVDLSTQESNLVLLATDADCNTEDADEVAQLRSHHQLILNSAGEGVWGLDKDGKITFGNKAAVEILGWKLDQVLGQSSHEVHHHSHADGAPYPRSECPIFASLKDGEVHKVDNEVFWHTNGDPIKHPDTQRRQTQWRCYSF
jgi:PAS domain-containing protein